MATYVLAQDSDFSGDINGEFRYIGSHEYIEIPHIIKDEPVFSYEAMFLNNEVIKGVKHTNSDVVNMSRMFSRTKNDLELLNWDLTNVANTSRMFDGFSKKLVAENWVIGANTSVSEMFYGANIDYLDVNTWDTEEAVSFKSFFEDARIKSLELIDLDISNIKSFQYMFNSARIAELDLSTWDVYNIETFDGMFSQFVGNVNMRGWNVNGYMGNMFSSTGSSHIFNVENWVIGANTRFGGMFTLTGNTSFDFSNWDISGTTDLSDLFRNSSIYSVDLSMWDVSHITKMDSMFDTSYAMSNVDVSGWDMFSVTSARYMFGGLNVVNAKNWKIGKDTNLAYLVANDFDLKNLIFLVDNWDLTEAVSLRGIFSGSLGNNYNLDLSTWDVSNIEDMGYMFRNYKGDLNIQGWDTSNVKNMEYMFYEAKVKQEVFDILDTSNVKNMNDMFSDYKDDLDLSMWDVSNVTNMGDMFRGFAHKLDVSNWRVFSLENASYMFVTASSNFELTIKNWELGINTYLASMFTSVSVDLDLSTWDVSKATTLRALFSLCKSGSINVRGWNTRNVIDIANVFENTLLDEIDLSDWELFNVTNTGSAFRGTKATVGWASSIDDATKLNLSSNKPAELIFNVKLTPLLNIPTYTFEEIEDGAIPTDFIGYSDYRYLELLHFESYHKMVMARQVENKEHTISMELWNIGEVDVHLDFGELGSTILMPNERRYIVFVGEITTNQINIVFSATDDIKLIGHDFFIKDSGLVPIIDKNNMKSLSLKEELMPINIVNLINEDEIHEEQKYPPDWESLPFSSRSEIIFGNNSIIGEERHRYIIDMFNALHKLAYRGIEAETYGTMFLEPFDVLEVIDMEGIKHRSVITSHDLTVNSGIKENIKSELPTNMKEKFKIVTSEHKAVTKVDYKVSQSVDIGLANRTDIDGNIENTANNLRLINVNKGNIASNLVKINENRSLIDNFESSDNATSLLDKQIVIDNFIDKDKFALVYDETLDQFMLEEIIGGVAEITQATETTLGGVKAKARTSENAEVVIDSETGKLYAPSIGGEEEIKVSIIETANSLLENSSSTSLELLDGQVGDKVIAFVMHRSALTNIEDWEELASVKTQNEVQWQTVLVQNYSGVNTFDFSTTASGRLAVGLVLVRNAEIVEVFKQESVPDLETSITVLPKPNSDLAIWGLSSVYWDTYYYATKQWVSEPELPSITFSGITSSNQPRLGVFFDVGEPKSLKFDNRLDDSGYYKEVIGISIKSKSEEFKVESFKDLIDTPESYVGNAKKPLIVNDTEDGIIFGDVASGSFEVINENTGLPLKFWVGTEAEFEELEEVDENTLYYRSDE